MGRLYTNLVCRLLGTSFLRHYVATAKSSLGLPGRCVYIPSGLTLPLGRGARGRSGSALPAVTHGPVHTALTDGQGCILVEGDQLNPLLSI